MKSEFIQIGVFFLIGFVVEALTIADEANTAGNVGFNVLWAILRTLFDGTVGGVITLWLAIKLSSHFFPLFPMSRIAWAMPAAFLALVARDFFYYWFHRLQHWSSWLWAEHELHHSDEHMNVTTALRHHWLETPLEAALVTIPTAILFGDPRISLASYVLTRASGNFIHLNSRINLGLLFGSPAVHRVHHSKLPEHIDKNFAAVFPLWDFIFGTYCKPPKSAPPTGLASGETVYSIPYALVMPFAKWRKMIRPVQNGPTSLCGIAEDTVVAGPNATSLTQ